MQQLINLLESVAPLPEDCKSYLSSVVIARQLRKKEYLLKAGHICRNMCFVETGLLRCYYINGQTEVCSWFMKEGDVIISIESFYQQKASYESIQAVEDCVVYSIEYNQLQELYKNVPVFNLIGRIFTEKYHQFWATQLYALRMKQAPERYNWLMEKHPELILRVPAKYLASYLGITEVMLSKIKSRR